MKPIEIFLSYSHRDEALMRELVKHLSRLQREGWVQTWHDRKITPGSEWKGQIDQHLESAQIILLLVSADFMASDYCYDVELKRARARHQAGEACVIPVILRPVDWKEKFLGSLQALPTDGRPITLWEDQDEAFLNVVKGILREIEFPQNEVNPLVQKIREQISSDIQKRCGTMRVLDMEQPITVDSIYTTVNILEKMSRNQRLSLKNLLDGCELESFDRFLLGKARQERIPGVEAVQRHDKLLILGKPGAGKTTFLKWLALQCKEGELYPERVPIFVTLKEFAEEEGQPTLIEFIAGQFAKRGIEQAQGIVETLLKAGRGFVFLDGLDEVRKEDDDRILNIIDRTSKQFDGNQFVMTCRIAAKEYIFEQFTEVEIADFNQKQIADFANKWFQKDSDKAKEFPKELSKNKGLQELATNPLLLTLLCLVFEAQAGFPANRSELYKEGLDVLLKKWDVNRNIRREQVYQQLSLQRKKDLLSQIAVTAFVQGEYFFKQRFVEEEIRNYICNLPNADTNDEVLHLDSEAVLKSIEANHGLLVERARGIYSFSHLTFQEYFTARYFKEKSDSDFSDLVCHITEKRWREIFLLTTGMLKNADKLLLGMKTQIDGILAHDEKFQQFLTWVEQKSISAPFKSAAIRAFYFDLDCTFDRNRAFPLDLDKNLEATFEHYGAHDDTMERSYSGAYERFLKRNAARNLSLELDSELAQNLARAHEMRSYVRGVDRMQACAKILDPDLGEKLTRIRRKIPFDIQELKQELRQAMIQHRNIGHDWQFTQAQKELLQQYYDANRLLVACLNSDCYVSGGVKDKIERTLLLPVRRNEEDRRERDQRR